MKPYRLAIVMSHPIQYHAPFFGFLARDSRFQIHVFYLSDRGARPFYERLSQTVVRFDNPILEGYKHTLLTRGEPQGWISRRMEFFHPDLGKKILEFSPHAVYFHGYTYLSYWLAFFLCRRYRIPVLFRGENEEVLPRPFWRRFLRETLLTFLLPRIDAFLYIGKHNKDFFLRRNVPEDKLFFVPYAVDNRYFRDGHSSEPLQGFRNEILSRYGLSADTRLFIYTHKFRPSMRSLDAVEAFCRAIDSKDLPAALLMCGDGRLRCQTERVAHKKGKGKIVFTGYLSQGKLKKYLLACDVLVNPAMEPWGCSLNEGLACGLVLVSSDKVVGHPDMVVPGVNGYVYPCGDLTSLSRLFEKLCLLSGEELKKMKQASVDLSQKLSFSTGAQGLAMAMERVCSRR